MATEFKHVKEHAQEILMAYSKRNEINAAMEDLYWMRWQDQGAVAKAIGDIVKVTNSPRASNALEGMIRLLCASDPIFSVPQEDNSEITNANSEKLEKFCHAMFQASGKIVNMPLHYEVVRSAMLFDEIVISLQSTKELEKACHGTAKEVRAAEIAQRTPFLFKAEHPSDNYPEFDEMGLCFCYSKRKVKQSDVMAAFGEKAVKQLDKLNQSGTSKYKEVELHDAYDLETRTVWINNADEPIVFDLHEYPFIPKIIAIPEGSNLFSKPEEKRHPALYNLWKSGLIERQNLFLTVLYTMIFALGGNPMFVEYLHNPQNPPIIDYSIPGYTARYRVGERREPMAKQLLDPSLMQGWQIAQELEMESTIYRQTLGEPLGANAPYSMVALLSQSGRLPLIMPQRIGGFAIARAAEYALKIMRKEQQRGQVAASGIYSILEPNEIPEYFEVEAKLDIAMPQDLLNNVNAAVMGTSGDNPLFDINWAREKLLQIGQPKQMQKAIWDQKVSQLYYMKFINDQMAAAAQAMQAAQNPPTNASGIPGQERGVEMPEGVGTPSLTQPSKPFPNMPSPFEPAQPMMPPDQAMPV